MMHPFFVTWQESIEHEMMSQNISITWANYHVSTLGIGKSEI